MKKVKPPRFNFMWERIRMVRREKQLTIEDVAYLCRMNSADVTNIEGGFYPTPIYLAAIARVLGVSTAWLQFGRE